MRAGKWGKKDVVNKYIVTAACQLSLLAPPTPLFKTVPAPHIVLTNGSTPFGQILKSRMHTVEFDPATW